MSQIKANMKTSHCRSP